MSGQRRSVPPAGAGRGTNAISRPAWAAMRSASVGDRDLFGRADVVDAEMLALRAHHHDAAHEIVDVAEAAGLAAVALDLERQRAGRVLRRGAL